MDLKVDTLEIISQSKLSGVLFWCYLERTIVQEDVWRRLRWFMLIIRGLSKYNLNYPFKWGIFFEFSPYPFSVGFPWWFLWLRSLPVDGSITGSTINISRKFWVYLRSFTLSVSRLFWQILKVRKAYLLQKMDPERTHLSTTIFAENIVKIQALYKHSKIVSIIGWHTNENDFKVSHKNAPSRCSCLNWA